MRELIKRIITDKDRTRGGAVLRPVLAFFSFIYGGVVVLARGLYRAGILPSYRPKYPVISVGNITVGGVGKTPMVLFLVRSLQARGMRPIVLTRGYMGQADGYPSDEAAMISGKTHAAVMVNPDRVAAARNAEACGMGNVFVLDDGFQHARLKRDLDIVLIDMTDPFGNGYLLPRGILREPLAALARADLFVLTRTDLGREHVAGIRGRIEAIKPGALIVETVHAPVALRDAWGGAAGDGLSGLKDRIVGVCAIGAPDAFTATLTREGAHVEKMFAFDDHHVYTADDVRPIAAFCAERKIGKIITTDKDAVKLKAFQEVFQGVNLLVLEVEIKVVHGQAEFFSRIDRCFNS